MYELNFSSATETPPQLILLMQLQSSLLLCILPHRDRKQAIE